LESGFKAANGSFIVSMDADGQYDPRDIGLFLKEIEKGDFDVVCGWRKNRNDPFVKIVASLAGNYLRRAAFGERIHDVGCSFRIYSHNALADLKLTGERHRFITAILKMKGFCVGEIVVRHYPRVCGKSKYGVLDRAINSIPFFLKLMVSRLSRK